MNLIAAQVVVTGAKTTTAASTSGHASKNTPPGPAPTALADGDEWYDSTQLAIEFRQATNTTLVRGGAVSGRVVLKTVSRNGAVPACRSRRALMVRRAAG